MTDQRYQMELGAEIEALLNRSKTRIQRVAVQDKRQFQHRVEQFTLTVFVIFIIALIGFCAGNQNRYPDGTKAEPVSTIEVAYAASGVVQSPAGQSATSTSQVEPEPSSEPTRNRDSWQNFPTAVSVVGQCQENETCRDMVARWETAGYDEITVIRMILIMNKESGWQYDQVSTNTNGSRDVGAYQINTGWHCGKVGQARNSQACIDALLDPDTNTRVAMEIFDAQGWSPWVARKAYLPEFWADRVTL